VSSALRLTSGVWVDYNRDRGNDPLTVSPRVGAIWKPKDKTTFKFLFNQAFLRPSNFQTVNNPVIESETMQQFDLIWMQDWSPFSVTVNAYAQKLDGFINIVSIGSTSRFENSGVYKSKGVEVDLAAKLTDHLTIWSNASYGSTSAGEFPAGLSLTNRRILPDGTLLSYPELTFNIGGTLRTPGKKFFAAPAVRYTGAMWYRENAPKLADLTDSTYRETKAATLVDVNFGWEPNDRYSVYFNVVNAFDDKSRTHQGVWDGSMTTPGRYYELTVQAKW
jgi:outer membrane receptor protein involved in Fe transport